ncbi:MarR family winged helix-turn-helix transcriptional regulator [Brevibacillus sp. NRS-1366]|uniref:MarR family winged helix-turn-helix transcriptional regulator n=1 Tax=Brevibacillus sp. NRS-1366 TaxID=3233899 RepID=UPI003D212F73
MLFIFSDSSTQVFLKEIQQDLKENDLSAAETWLHLLKTISDMYGSMGKYLARYNFSQAKLNLLMLLYSNQQLREEELTPSELAERTNVTRGTITGLLDGLEREGYVQRRNHPHDRRKITIFLTEKGKDLLFSILPEQLVRISTVLADISVEERKTLIELLGKIQTGLTRLE